MRKEATEADRPLRPNPPAGMGPRGRSASVLAYDYPGLPLDMKKFKAASGELTASEMELVANQKRSPWPHQGG